MDTLDPGRGNRDADPAGQGQIEARSQSGQSSAEPGPGFIPGLAAASIEAWNYNLALFSWAQDQAECMARIWLDQGGISREQARSTAGDVAIQQRQVRVGKLTAAYLTAGEGPPLVLLHGHGESSGSWRWVLPALARAHRVYAPDFPGSGGSAKPAAYAHPPAFYSDFLADFLDALGLERAALVANSHGGLVALRLACAVPARVTALVLVDSSGLGREIHPALVGLTLPGYGEAAMAWLKTPLGAAQWAWGLAALVLARPLLAPPEWLAQHYRLAQTPGHLEGTLACLRGELGLWGQREVFWDELLRLTMPTLVVWGAYDAVIPVSHASSAVERLPQGHLALIPDCGHVPHVERPDRFVAALGRFLAEHRGDTGRFVTSAG